MAEQMAVYPVQVTIDYPDRKLDKLTTFFRIFTTIPAYIILTLILGGSGCGGGLVILPTLLMILFRQKYPRWWFDWNLALMQYLTRVNVYLYLMTDVYPSTDEEQGVHIAIVYPDAQKDLNRWLPLVKWLLAIPHYIVLYCLFIAEFVCIIIAWFAILINGRFPRGIFDFMVGVTRWSIRVTAYACLLTTDIYPPFSLE